MIGLTRDVAWPACWHDDGSFQYRKTIEGGGSGLDHAGGRGACPCRKDFDLLNIPGGEHTVGRSTGPIDYAHRRQFDFFVRHLQDRQTPAWNTMPGTHTK